MDRSAVAPQWDELARIDYLLNELASGVERGDIPADVYDRMAPRYLDRREVLVAAIERRQPTRQGSEAAPDRVSLGRPDPSQRWDPASVEHPVAKAPAESRPVPWTTVLTFLGAFLVVVAAAIFTAATWETMNVGVRLGFLGTLTLGFYAAGFVALRRFELRVGAVALTVVGSAMLLFDGWIVISGLRFTGAWPWAVLLLGCSAVYWATEISLAGGLFGVIGAASQVAWWWMFGAALGWTELWRFAGLAVIALLWGLAGWRARGESTVGSLARVLDWAAPALALISVIGSVPMLMAVDVGWTQVASSVVVGMALIGLALIARKLGVLRGTSATRDASSPAYLLALGLGALGQIPLAIAVGASSTTPPGWSLIGLLVGLVFVYALVEARIGGYIFGVLATLAEIAAWLAFGAQLLLTTEGKIAIFAGVALAWQIGAHVLRRSGASNDAWPGVTSLLAVTEVGGWALLVLATLSLSAARGTLPLAGPHIESAFVAVSGVLLAAWTIAAVVRKDPVQSIIAFFLELWTAAALMGWALPGLHGALYATGLLAIAAVLLHARAFVERATRLERFTSGWLARIAAGAVIVSGLAVAANAPRFAVWQTVVLIGAGAAFWASDALHDGPIAGWGVAAALTVFAARVGGEALRLEGLAALAGAGVGLALVAGSAMVTSRWRLAAAAAALGASIAASIIAFGVGDERTFAIALALVACTWVAALLPTGRPECAGIGALFASGAIVAGIAAVQPSPWVLIVAGCLVPAALLVPAWLVREDSRGWPIARVLTVAGLVDAAALTVLGVVSAWADVPLPTWAAIGEQGAAVALLALGAFVVISGARFDLEPALYGGAFIMLAGVWAEFGALDQTRIELYTTTLAAYLIDMGYFYASRDPRRSVPFTTDVAAMVVGLGVPTLLSLGNVGPTTAWQHATWAILLALLAIAGGISRRVRVYFFAGVAALALTAIFRSILFLAEYWFITLGLVGLVMLTVALTWERQRILLTEAGRRVQDTFAGWR